ncbi:hypothetical protein MXD61_21905 [Frankia sp. AgPm24]|nr:hypothetical protein [Frankia sp. AgPm24]
MLAALAAAVATLTALGAAHAAGGSGGNGAGGAGRPTPTPVVRMVSPHMAGSVPYPRVGTRLTGPAANSAALASGSTSASGSSSPTDAPLPALDDVPAFRGAVSQLAAGQSFVGFIADHEAEVVLLDLLAPTDGNGQSFFPGPDLGGESVPNFTLYDSCNTLSLGQAPGSDTALGCTGTTYRLSDMAGRGATFDSSRGFYRLHGYFRVHIIGTTRTGITAVNLLAIDPNTLPGSG